MYTYAARVVTRARCRDHVNDLAARTQRNALSEMHLRRPAASPDRNAIVHAAPLYLWGTAFPGGGRGDIGRFPASIMTGRRFAQGHLDRCIPTTCVLHRASLGRGVIAQWRAPLSILGCSIDSSYFSSEFMTKWKLTWMQSQLN